jgi:hypothetical protein
MKKWRLMDIESNKTWEYSSSQWRVAWILVFLLGIITGILL